MGGGWLPISQSARRATLYGSSHHGPSWACAHLHTFTTHRPPCKPCTLFTALQTLRHTQPNPLPCSGTPLLPTPGLLRDICTPTTILGWHHAFKQAPHALRLSAECTNPGSKLQVQKRATTSSFLIICFNFVLICLFVTTASTCVHPPSTPKRASSWQEGRGVMLPSCLFSSCTSALLLCSWACAMAASALVCSTCGRRGGSAHAGWVGGCEQVHRACAACLFCKHVSVWSPYCGPCIPHAHTLDKHKSLRRREPRTRLLRGSSGSSPHAQLDKYKGLRSSP